MAKIEHGEGRLLSIDTDNKTLRFQEISRVSYAGKLPPKEWEHPYILKLIDQEFFDLVGKPVKYTFRRHCCESISSIVNLHLLYFYYTSALLHSLSLQLDTS